MPRRGGTSKPRQASLSREGCAAVCAGTSAVVALPLWPFWLLTRAIFHMGIPVALDLAMRHRAASVYDARDIYADIQPVVAPSPYNVIGQSGSLDPISYTLSFSQLQEDPAVHIRGNPLEDLEVPHHEPVDSTPVRGPAPDLSCRPS